MDRSRNQIARALVAAVLLALGMASSSFAQGRGAGGPPGGGGPGGGGMNGPQFPGPGGGPGGPGGPGMGGNQPRPGQAGQPPEPRPGLQLGPPGRWWDDRGIAKSLKLRPEQQTRMDAIFEQNRAALLTRFETVHQAEAQMEELSKSSTPDEGALFAQIDRVSQARAELEKATTHMLLQIRKEMDADQIKKLEKETQK
jgi:Spy/CpxP family protein refolding chaperone